MDAIAFIAEKRIEQAIEDGVFDNLPGMGKPLVLEDLSALPPELRMAYTVLKNSGYIEKKPEPGKCVTTAELLENCPEERQTYGKIVKLQVMLRRVCHARGKTPDSGVPQEDIPTSKSAYGNKLVARL